MDWSNPLPDHLGEREPAPRGIRFPKQLAADLEQLAEQQGRDFTTVTLYLLRGAVAEVQARQAKPKPKSSPKTLKRAS